MSSISEDLVDSVSMAELARSRSGCYALFAAVFARPPDRAFLSLLQSSEAGAVLGSSGIGDLSAEGAAGTLAVEYTSLFVGPGPHLTPCEVKSFIQTSGLHFRADWSGLPDHISAELEFMKLLCDHEAGLWGGPEKMDDLRLCLETEESFLSDHLMAWVPSFCDRVAERSDGYYGEMARLTKEFLAADIEHVDEARQKASPAQLSPGPQSRA